MNYGTMPATVDAAVAGWILVSAVALSLFALLCVWAAKREEAEWEVMKPCPTCGIRRPEHQTTPLDNLGVRELRELRDAQTNKFQAPNPVACD